MNAAYPQQGHPGTVPSSGFGNRTLREALSRRTAAGQRVPLEVAVGQLVPLCLELAEVHDQGYGFYLHPSSVTETADGRLTLAREVATLLPSDPRDRACLPPETQPGQLNDARGNVYAMGAMLYEMVTGESVGRGMRRPSDVVPGLPKELETVLAVGLIIDAERRPGDLRALAQSIREIARSAAPMSVISQPHRAPVISYHSQPIPIDVSMSLLPPEPVPEAAPIPREAVAPASVAAVNGYGVAVQAAVESSSAADSAAGAQAAQAVQFAELKAQLESDPRPRYFVQKSGMDHGPFTAVELVRHIDSLAFSADDRLIDSLDGRHAPIRDWPQFAQFADHAKRNRELSQRQKDIVKVAALEKKSSRGKTVIGLLMLVGILGVAGAWYSQRNSDRDDRVEIQGDEATNVETESSLSIKGKKKARRKGGGASGIPTVAGGQSCEAAMDAYNEEKVMGQQGQADLTEGQYGRVLNGGGYFSHCGVSLSMTVNICAAVQNGRAVGVTVRTQPNDPKKESCIAGAVRGLNFPSHPKLDVTRTRFDAQ
jgi:eukaryotic-like serine/threonine-protein kinase